MNGTAETGRAHARERASVALRVVTRGARGVARVLTAAFRRPRRLGSQVEVKVAPVPGWEGRGAGSRTELPRVTDPWNEDPWAWLFDSDEERAAAGAAGSDRTA